MDFSKPVNSSQNSIDISTNNITTDIHLPVYIDDGTLFISDGVMHMLPGGYEDTANFTNTGWNFNLKNQKLDVQDLGTSAKTIFSLRESHGLSGYRWISPRLHGFIHAHMDFFLLTLLSWISPGF